MHSEQSGSVRDYDRRIKYLDYMENGERSRGAGFVKLERRGQTCGITLQISGLYRKDRFTRPFLLFSGEEEKEFCKLQIADGGAKIVMEKLDSDDLDGKGMRYEQLTGLRIPLSEGKEIRCMWEAKGSAPVRTEFVEREEKLPDPQEPPEIRIEEAGQEESGQEAIRQEVTGQEAPGQEAPGQEAPEKNIRLLDNKWEQLWMIYPHIRPFQDDREYLSMGPGDFVILPGKYYKLVNNSFLLHGYYNYHHLIMSRLEQRNQARYFIGVPGNYYEREKKIAVMFGFENFECEREPAQDGDFGYYMISVEL